jgi:DNA-binding NarL/FixJ family response regulator
MIVAAANQARIGLIDDHPLFRRGLAAVLTQVTTISVVGEASNAEEALELFRTTPLDLAVVDILMPTVSGISLAAEIYELQPACRILGLSVIDEPGIVADMLRARASGYALKTQPVGEIIDAILHVLGGVRYLPPTCHERPETVRVAGDDGQPHARLTKREREVFELLIRGHNNDDIAERLAIAQRTVETHRQRIVNKLSPHSVVQIQRLAARHGGLGR